MIKIYDLEKKCTKEFSKNDFIDMVQNYRDNMTINNINEALENAPDWCQVL